MEASQLLPSSTEPLPQPTLQSSISYFDRVKSRLARIPTTPAFIVLPSSAFQVEKGKELEPAESPLTVTTPSTVTEPPPRTSTAATSVLSLPQVFVVQKFHVSPNMPIDEKIQLIWTQQIRSRLSAVLLHTIPTGTCVQEFMMAGKRPNALKPTVVITCGDAETKKRAEKSFKSQGWLQELMKANGIMFVALVAKTSLSAGPALQSPDTDRLSECCSVQLLNGPAATSCGLPLLVNPSEAQPQRHCTLGGLLMVNGVIFGLTAGHPFKAHLEQRSAHNELHDIGQDARTPVDDESSDASGEPFVFNDDDSSRGSVASTSTVSLYDRTDFSSTSIDDPTYGQHDILKTFSPSIQWSQPYNAIVPLTTPNNALASEEPHGDCDWALLEMLPHPITTLPNKIVHVDGRLDVPIERTVSGSAHGEVTITVAGIGARLGYLHSSPVTMKVNESISDVQLITLEHSLPLGSSGVWVVLGDQLCGFIVAIRQDVPWAYMIPIEPILEDIKQKFRTADIRLPRHDEIESLALLPEVSKTLTVVKNDGQTSGSDGRDISKPAAVSKKLSPWNYHRKLPSEMATHEYDTELPSEMATWKRLTELLSKTDDNPSNLQEDVIRKEKSSIEESMPEISLATQTHPRSELTGSRSEVNVSTAGGPRAGPSPIAHGVTSDRIPVDLELNRSVNPFASILLKNPDFCPPSSVPQRSGSRPSALPKIYAAPYTLWHRFETLMLHIEYRRRRARKRQRRSTLQLRPFLRPPRVPRVGEIDSLRSAMVGDLLISWHYIRLPFYALGNVVLNVLYLVACLPLNFLKLLYLVACLPFSFWIVNRHRDVFHDEDALERQRYESMEMLGRLPIMYDDARLIRQQMQYNVFRWSVTRDVGIMPCAVEMSQPAVAELEGTGHN